MDPENAKRLARHAAETRQKMARGEYSAFPIPTPKPAPLTRATSAVVRQAPPDPATLAAAEIYRLCHAAGKFDLAPEFLARRMSVGEVKQALAIEGWGQLLASAQAER